MPTLCVVPTPLRAARAARRLCDAQGGLLFGPVVVTPGALLPGILAASAERRPVLSPLAERLLALEAGRRAGGSLAGLDPAGGLARALATTLAELRRAEVPSGEAAEAASGLEGGAATRLGDVAAALAAYEARLSELGALDRPASFRQAARALRRGARSQETARIDLLVLEGFSDPAPGEWDLLSALLASARRAQARVPYHAARPDLCAPAEPLLRRIEAMHDAPGAEIEMVFPAGERAPGLSRLLAAVAGGEGGDPEPEGESVVGIPAAGLEGEADAAARLAAGFLDEGLSPEEIAVVSGSPSRHAPLLRRSFADLGIPLAASRGSPLAEALPVQVVRRALAAGPRPSRRAAEELALSGWLDVPRLPSRLSRWLDRAGAVDGRGDPAEALRRRAARLTSAGASGERRALLASAEALAWLGQLLGPLAAPGTGREMAARLRAFVGRAGMRRRAGRAQAEVASRDLAALSRLEELADELAQALALAGRGGERLSPGEWGGLLDLALAGASAPPPVEPSAGAVELWPLEEAPGLAVRAAILVGCGRGNFPPAPPPDALLRDAERIAVNRRLGRLALETSGDRRRQGAYRAFSAMAAGSERLAFTWPAAGPAGPGESPAPMVAEAMAAAGVAPAPPPQDPDLAGARSAAEALRAAARLSRRGLGASALEALGAAGGDLAARGASALARGLVEEERRESLAARRSGRFGGRIPAELLSPLAAALPVEWSPTQLETWANCPFALFLRLALGLPDRETAALDIDPRDEGSLAHAILERFVGSRRARGGWPLRGTAEERAEAREAAERVFEAFEAEGRVGDPAAWAARREAVLARIDRAIDTESAAADGLVPQLIEHRFGGTSPSPPLVFEDGGERVLLRGRIDRVDADAHRILVIDYKNARNGRSHREKLQTEAMGATSFQVPAYLLAAARELPGRSTLMASFALLRASERIGPWRASAGDDLFAVDEARRAEARARGGRTFADAVVAAVRRIRRGDFPVASRDCGQCGFGAVCRFPEVAEEGP